jgi:hypothetical protein
MLASLQPYSWMSLQVAPEITGTVGNGKDFTKASINMREQKPQWNQ